MRVAVSYTFLGSFALSAYYPIKSDGAFSGGGDGGEPPAVVVPSTRGIVDYDALSMSFR